MSNTFTISIDVEVFDERQLYEAAIHHAIHNDGLTRTQASEMLLYGEEDDTSVTDREYNVGACLQMLADPGMSWPGTSILQSFVEG